MQKRFEDLKPPIEQNLSSNSAASVPSIAAVKAAVLNSDKLSEGSTNLYFTNARAIASTLTSYVKATANRAIAATDSILTAIGLLEKQTADVKAYAQSKQYGIFNEQSASTNSDNNGAFRLTVTPSSETDYISLYTPNVLDAGVMAQVICSSATSTKTSRLAVRFTPSNSSASVTICTLAPGESALCAVIVNSNGIATWFLFAKESSKIVVYAYFTPAAIKSAVKAGSFTNGELQGTQPTGSQQGMRFVDASYRYEYMTSNYDTDGTTFVWVRTIKDINQS